MKKKRKFCVEILLEGGIVEGRAENSLFSRRLLELPIREFSTEASTAAMDPIEILQQFGRQAILPWVPWHIRIR